MKLLKNTMTGTYEYYGQSIREQEICFGKRNQKKCDYFVRIASGGGGDEGYSAQMSSDRCAKYN